MIFLLKVWFHQGMSEKADYELCTRVEDVHLPKSGVFGVSAATGGLAGIEHYELTALFLFNQSFTKVLKWLVILFLLA